MKESKLFKGLLATIIVVALGAPTIDGRIAVRCQQGIPRARRGSDCAG